MKLGDKYFPVSAAEMLAAMQIEARLRGLPYFADVRDSAANVMTQCPYHKGGMERKPSFGINKETGECNCFACGPKGTIDKVVSNIFYNVSDDGSLGRRWLASKFLNMSIANRAALDLSALSRQRNDANKIVRQPFDEEELNQYRYYHEYMWERGFDEKTVQLLDIGYDWVTDSLTFPVYHVDGSPAFIARRSVSSKFFNYPEACTKPVYGAHMMEHIKQMPYYNRGVLIVESVTNMVTAWVHGWPALSLLGTGSSFQYEVLRRLPIRSYVLALDPDEAGDKGEIKLRRNLGSKKVLRKLVIPEGSDINDLRENFLTLDVVL